MVGQVFPPENRGLSLSAGKTSWYRSGTRTWRSAAALHVACIHMVINVKRRKAADEGKRRLRLRYPAWSTVPTTGNMHFGEHNVLQNPPAHFYEVVQ